MLHCRICAILLPCVLRSGNCVGHGQKRAFVFYVPCLCLVEYGWQFHIGSLSTLQSQRLSLSLPLTNVEIIIIIILFAFAGRHLVPDETATSSIN